MVYQAIRYLLVLVVLLPLTGHSVTAQSRQIQVTPPYLKDGQKLHHVLMLGYRGEVNTYIVITVKFRISAAGMLDTLAISDNAPQPFIDNARQQLSRLNGSWVPQTNRGKAVLSNWLVSHYYIGGFRTDTSASNAKLQDDFLAAFKREEELFLCDQKVDPPLKCLIDYVEGSRYYLLPPLLSNTVR